MKICIDCRLLSKKPTGISSLTLDLIDYYCLRYGNDNVIGIVNNDFDCNYDIFFIRTDLKPFNLLHFLFFRKFIISLNVDLLHTPFYSGLFFKIKNLIVITTLPDLMYRFIPGFFGNNWLKNILARIYFDLIVRLTLKSSDLIISISATTASDLLTWLNLKSIVIYPVVSVNSPNVDNFTLDKFFNKFNIIENGYFLYVGNNRPHKNLDYLINEFKSSNSSYKLIIAGNHIFNDIDSRIVGIGPVTDIELSLLYKNMHCLIFPSKYEGFGLPLIESSLMCKRVIASDIPVFREIKNPLITLVDVRFIGSLTMAINSISTLDSSPIFVDIGFDFSIFRFQNELDGVLSSFVS